MLQPLIEVMGQAYPELEARREVIEATLIREEQFAKTLEQGLKLLEGELAQLKIKLFRVRLYLNFTILMVSQQI